MISRMTKAQRQSIIDLIKSLIKEEASEDIEDVVTRMGAEEEFHKQFGNDALGEDEPCLKN